VLRGERLLLPGGVHELSRFSSAGWEFFKCDGGGIDLLAMFRDAGLLLPGGVHERSRYSGAFRKLFECDGGGVDCHAV